MKIYRKAEDWDLFSQDRIYAENGEVWAWIKALFDQQDKVAEESPVFARILQREIREDPEERLDSTNSPKSKVRNALLSRTVYHTQDGKFDKKSWEENLLNNPYYQ